MRIGSISQGKLKCDGCGQTVPYAGRYLIVNETDGVEDEEHGIARRYCAKCADEKGYSDTRVEKGETILTFFQKTDRLLEPSAEPDGKEAKAEVPEKVAETENDANE